MDDHTNTPEQPKRDYSAATQKMLANQDWQRNVAEANRRKAADPEFQERRREASRQANSSPEWLEKIAESNRQRSASPEWRASNAAMHEKRWADPEYRKQNAERRRAQAWPPGTTTKVCSCCKQEQNLDRYYKNKSRPGGIGDYCKNCLKEKNRDQREKHADRIKARQAQNFDLRRDQQLRKAYGITLEQYNELLVKQNSLCAICNKPEVAVHQGGRVRLLAVDHDHDTGVVRGLLCGSCNRALGMFLDSPEVIRRALEYLCPTS